MLERWGSGSFELTSDGGRHEAGLLKLDCSKAQQELNWRPALDLDGTIDQIIEWHRAHVAGEDAAAVSRRQLTDYQVRLNAVLQESNK